jgi:hypothetical protein
MCFYFICNRPDQTRMLTFVPTSFDQRLFLINFHEKFDFVGIESPLEIFTITCPSHWTLYHNAFIYVSTSYYTISVETLSILHNILHFLLRQNSKIRLNTLKKNCNFGHRNCQYLKMARFASVSHSMVIE